MQAQISGEDIKLRNIKYLIDGLTLQSSKSTSDQSNKPSDFWHH